MQVVQVVVVEVEDLEVVPVEEAMVKEEVEVVVKGVAVHQGVHQQLQVSAQEALHQALQVGRGLTRVLRLAVVQVD